MRETVSDPKPRGQLTPETSPLKPKNHVLSNRSNWQRWQRGSCAAFRRWQARPRLHTGAAKLAHLNPGIEVARGDLTEPDSFAKAVAGVEGVFLMNRDLDPNAFRRVIEVTKASGNPRVVFLSVLFAQYPGVSIGQMHKEKEDVLPASGLPVSFLRVGNFMTNTFQWLESIKRDGVVLNAFGAGKFAPVAPQGIAAVAVQALTTPNPQEIYEVTGGELLSLPQQVEILSHVTGKHIGVVEISSEQEEASLLKAGISPFIASTVSQAYEEIRNGKLDFLRDTVQKAKGTAPVTY
ncbi:MAG TPA: NAD(P)H-binding protein [Acidobacteriaceae bacterium]